MISVSTVSFTPWHKRRRPTGAAARVLLLAVALLLGLAATGRAADETPHFFRIGTGAVTGTAFEIGAEIANAISKPPGSRPCDRGGSCGVEGLVAIAQASEGSIENALAVQAGRLEGALIRSDIASWAYRGDAPAFRPCRGRKHLPQNGTNLLRKAGPLKKLRAIAALYPDTLQIVARADSGITRLADLKGKRVALGAPASDTLAEARRVLHAADLSECLLKARYPRLSEAAALLENGRIDAFFVSGSVPVPAVAEAASAVPIRLVPLSPGISDRLIRETPFASTVALPQTAYHNLTRPTPTVSVPILFVVSADLPDDLVYKITRALWQGATRRLLDTGHPAGKLIRLKTASRGVGIPFHPGAARYYHQVGINVPHYHEAGTESR